MSASPTVASELVPRRHPRRIHQRTDLEVQLQVIESKLDMILTALGVEFRGRTVDELMELAGATPEQIARSRQGRTSDS